jgi:hypothetical protein
MRRIVTYRGLGARAALVIVCAMSLACGDDSPSGPSGGGPSAASPGTTTVCLSGTWYLQTRASASCANTLPAASRNRSYSTVSITQSQGVVTATITSGLGFSGAFVMTALLTGNQLQGQLLLGDTNPPDGVKIEGGVTGTATNTTINATLNGYFTPTTPTGPLCIAADHTMTFTKR